MIGKPRGKIPIEWVDIAEVDQFRIFLQFGVHLINIITPNDNCEEFSNKYINEVEDEILLISCSNTVINPSRWLENEENMREITGNDDPSLKYTFYNVYNDVLSLVLCNRKFYTLLSQTIRTGRNSLHLPQYRSSLYPLVVSIY